MGYDAGITSFGRYLNAVRLKKGIRIEDVSREIRVGVDALELIEREEHDRLPAAIYVRGFIKAYAGCIGADVDGTLRSYRESLSAHERAGEAARRLRRHIRRFWLNLFLSFGGLLLTVVATVSFFPGTKENGAENGIADRPVTEGRTAADVKNPPAGPESGTEVHAGKLVLSITAIRDTRFKVIIDHHPAEERVIRADEQMELQADEKFNFLLRDAGAVRMKLNDKPFPVFGASGQPVNIEIP
jgi:cytoskeleton protein RodZ